MKIITMTAEQTEAYDADAMGVMKVLSRKAQEMANESGETVEIYTEDGILTDVRYANSAA